jgi:2-dehydropantoate 2-reductase
VSTSRGSSWQSLQRCTGDIETDYLNREIVLLGRLYGVLTPANELMQQLARECATGRRTSCSVPESPVLDRLARTS